MIKTRLELLEEAHNSVSLQIINSEINLRRGRRALLTLKGDNQLELNKKIESYEGMVNELREVLTIIEEYIDEEKTTGSTNQSKEKGEIK